MLKRLSIALIALLVFACATPVIETPVDIGGTPLQDKYAPSFTIGVAVGPAKLAATGNIVDFHFNRLVCENDMKWGTIHPNVTTYNYANADAVANYARSRGIKLTGHTLIWHSQLPSNDWPFSGLTPNTQAARDALKTIMQNHITALVDRYYDVIDNWDVVNEAITETGYRDGTSSKWYQYFGSEEYLYWAFRYAKDALEAHGVGASLGKLYYNDYSVENSSKLTNIINMVKWLRGEQGTLPAGQSPIAIDGVGTQAHWNLTWPNTTTIQSTITALVNAGVKVKVSELDITIYANSGEAEKAFTLAIEQQQADRYRAIFQVFRANSANISSVTLWGVSDDGTWLDNFPVSGRNDYPLLFNDSHGKKLAYDAIIDF